MTTPETDSTDAAAPPPQILTVPPEAAGERLDLFLAHSLPQKSRAWFQQKIKDDQVSLNGKRARPSDAVKPGDAVTVHWPVERPFTLKPEKMDLDIILEDPDFFVINKPAGMVVHPAKGNWTGTLVQGLLAHAETEFAEMIDEEMRPGIVHRLDKDTSGALVIARTPDALTRLREAFKEHRTGKVYLALAAGGPFAAQSGKVEACIGRHLYDRKRMAVLKFGGKPSESHYAVVGEARGISLVRVCILTGRTHQIRVHLAHLKHPVLGDGLYGGRKQGLEPMPARQMLHSWKLSFPHPRTGATVEATAPPPADFLAALAALGLTLPAA
ncbi:MAG: RluA family pseudouridine synthase [Lentisphaeria bacterium]|jgi:23S rRNA pseudouridine1911/1915/1917 synthase